MLTYERVLRLAPYTSIVIAIVSTAMLALAAHDHNPWLAVCGVVIMSSCVFLASRISARLALTKDA
jgi:hypothetical protein